MNLSEQDIDRILQMAWEDRTPFEAIEAQFELTEKDVIALMRSQMKRSSFEMWRKRMKGRSTKHKALRTGTVERFHCSQQRSISLNKIAKRG
ncbi:MAG: TIGR03643 family protein [Spirosomataceae bacterium]